MTGRDWAAMTLSAACAVLVLVLILVCAVPAGAEPAPLRVCTANVQNTPDLPSEEVREDVRTARRTCDLILWQEIGERSDYRAVQDTLGARWRTTARARGGVPISWRTDRLRGAGDIQNLRVSDPTPRCRDGSPSYNPARWITLAPLRVRATGQRFTATSLHFPQRNGCRKDHRADRWRQAYATTQDHQPGGPLVIGGDWNRRELEIHPMTRWHWITPSPRALDHIAVARTGWTVADKFTRRLNSDHSLQGAVLNTRQED